MAASLYPPTQEEFETLYEIYRLDAPDAQDNIPVEWSQNCEVLVTSSGKGIENDVLEQLPAVKLISNFGTGTEKIDLIYCKDKNISVTHTPKVLTEDVADLALALILSTLRQIVVADKFVRNGAWRFENFKLTRSFRGLKIGLVGMGQIGREIARLCLTFGTEIGYHSPNQKKVDYRFFQNIEGLASWSDVLIAACPGGETTKGIISARVLDKLGADGIFINIARGSVVEEKALVERLIDGSIAGAGLDVYANEPEVPAQLLELDKVVLQPHLGSATHRSRKEMGNLTLANVAAFFERGALLTPVNT